MNNDFLQKHASNIVEKILNPLLILNTQLKVLFANQSFYNIFPITSDQLQEKFISDLGDNPELLELLQKTILQNSCESFEVDCQFLKSSEKKMIISVQKLCSEGVNSKLLILSIEGITRRRENTTRESHDKLELQVKEHTKELRIALSKISTLKNQLELEQAYLQEEIKSQYNYENIIGHSDEINYVFYKMEQIAGTDSNVLILGETGTGKELIARAIHNLSKCKNRPLVKINCATLPPTLIESELFGHEKGAFTSANKRQLGRFEIANGTTLFLDEIGELPLELQSKLLRVIQDGEFERLGSSQTIKVNVRLIAATNRNLKKEIARGRFREDLWYRLNVFPIILPPLRDRKGDIPLLVYFYVRKISRKLGKSIKIIPTNVMNALQNYQWLGNIRELENVIERAVLNSFGTKLCLAEKLESSQTILAAPKTLKDVEREHILLVLEQTKWKVSGKEGAAEILGLNRSTLRAKMRKLGIDRP
ncbi:sigma-54 interaction domain-containing protein [Candidatus Uabimicrobium sp. HlEnr_7]|uniref:sigma-54 interaction domain-containing protein n=1 Tax=Candidatus Uabimicrobium helgolandensis TaxID=3095367 RepID=UPI003558D573